MRALTVMDLGRCWHCFCLSYSGSEGESDLAGRLQGFHAGWPLDSCRSPYFCAFESDPAR